MKIKRKELGLDYEYDELLIVVPERFQDREQHCWQCKEEFHTVPCPTPGCDNELHVGVDGPCHSLEMVKKFWTEVLKSLDISLEFLLAEARDVQEDRLRRAASSNYFEDEEVFIESGLPHGSSIEKALNITSGLFIIQNEHGIPAIFKLLKKNHPEIFVFIVKSLS